jgi:hypothetical protein
MGIKRDLCGDDNGLSNPDQCGKFDWLMTYLASVKKMLVHKLIFLLHTQKIGLDIVCP